MKSRLSMTGRNGKGMASNIALFNTFFWLSLALGLMLLLFCILYMGTKNIDFGR